MAKGETWPDRDCMHKWMGPADSCEKCDGRGWVCEIVEGTEDDYIPDMREAYCDCPCGVLRMRVETQTARE